MPPGLGIALAITSIYPYFLTSAILLLLGWLISENNRFYRHLLDDESASKRFHAIDGLRGFLALGVFFHHSVISHFYYVHGHWYAPPSRFYTLLGHVGVALFFMITAFLFWTKGLHARPTLRVQTMLWSRLCRLLPMYLFSIACVFAIALVLSDFEMRQSLPSLVRQGLGWLSFGFLETGELNGLARSWLINGNVQWSLYYEWLFYLFLPLGLIFARGFGFLLLAIAVALIVSFFATKPVEWNFLFGALSALLFAHGGRFRNRIWQGWPDALAAIAALVLVFVIFDRGYGFFQACLLFGVFHCIANGNDLFGILTSRPARFLGAISYSIYMMHAIVLFVVLRGVNHHVAIASMSPVAYWLLVALCGIAVVAISSVTYRLVEHPWMKLPLPGWLGSHAPSPEAK